MSLGPACTTLGSVCLRMQAADKQQQREQNRLRERHGVIIIHDYSILIWGSNETEKNPGLYGTVCSQVLGILTQILGTFRDLVAQCPSFFGGVSCVHRYYV